ncbi:MAG: ATP-grasp domain-containing protein [Candidatus Omnitrophica bacterium]|nr:ATP-grasp domain-containing protein [Candidatus Omnitrophota bacterium]
MKKLRVLLLFDSPVSRMRGYDFKEEFKDVDWDTERSTYEVLTKAGHEVRILGLYNNINILLEEIAEIKPDIIFNMAEVFNQKSYLDKNVAGVLEMLDIPYTGASLTTLAICGDKALCKKILSFHRIKVPQFYTFYRHRRIWLPKRLRLPLIVKPLSEEASRGISQASIVDNEEAMIERVKFIHDSMKNDAIVEEYIEGRELYVSAIGDKRIKILPMREMKFGSLGEDEPRIATYKAKWDYKYRKKWEIKNMFAGRLPNGSTEKINEVCKRAFRALNLECYARFDIRLTNDSKIYILEVNANPSLDPDDELAQSAEKGGLTYDKLIQKILILGLKRGGNN